MGNDNNEDLRNRRRSSRIVLRVPLLINATEADSNTQWEKVETVVVSLHGGMVRTQQRFLAGSELDIRRLQEDRSARARVVWASSKTNPQGADLGFEILDDLNFWGVHFPPESLPATRVGQA